MRSPSSRSSSQIGVSHCAGPPLSTSAPQMSFTSTSRWPCSSRTRVGERLAPAPGRGGRPRPRSPRRPARSPARRSPRSSRAGRSRTAAASTRLLRPVQYDGRAGLAQRGRDPASGAAGRARDDRDAPAQGVGIGAPGHRSSLPRSFREAAGSNRITRWLWASRGCEQARSCARRSSSRSAPRSSSSA